MHIHAYIMHYHIMWMLVDDESDDGGGLCLWGTARHCSDMGFYACWTKEGKYTVNIVYTKEHFPYIYSMCRQTENVYQHARTQIPFCTPACILPETRCLTVIINVHEPAHIRAICIYTQLNSGKEMLV